MGRWKRQSSYLESMKAEAVIMGSQATKVQLNFIFYMIIIILKKKTMISQH